MFKITYIVDDKRLPDMLRGCSGHVYNLEVVPVANAEPIARPNARIKALPAPKVQEKHTGSRNFIQELGWKKGTQLRMADVAKRLPSLGMKKTSGWYVLMNELKAGRIKKVSQGLYEVVA
jgi:hypothetical protein